MKPGAIAALILTTLSLFLVGGCQATNSGTASLKAAAPPAEMHPSLAPYVLSGYRSLRGVNGKRRRGEHGGVDLAGEYKDPILAAADGVVAALWSRNTSCGIGVSIAHPDVTPSNLYTMYCHMREATVSKGQRVKRGDVIGYIGRTGEWAGVTHVHFVATTKKEGHYDGFISGSRDPALFLVGCYDPQERYDSSRFVLTAPIDCGGDSE